VRCARQHIDSFNFFLNVEMKTILKAPHPAPAGAAAHKVPARVSLGPAR
jgi:hypothetical protein